MPALTVGQPSTQEELWVDSLKMVIAEANSDKEIISAWSQWDNIIYNSNPELDYRLNQKIDSLCHDALLGQLTQEEKTWFLSANAHALNNLGMCSRKRGDCGGALAFYTKSLAIQRIIGNRQEIANILNNISNCYKEYGNYDAAIELYTKLDMS